MKPRTLRLFCTDKFITDHIYAVDDSGPGAKKRANVKAHERTVSVSTMVAIDAEYLKILWGEVFARNRDGTYAADPSGLFETVSNYMFFENIDRARAKKRGPAKFRYGVKYDDTAELYKIHHFDGML
jgi:hypothetical protein